MIMALTLAIGFDDCKAEKTAAEDSARHSAIALEQSGNDSDAEIAWRA